MTVQELIKASVNGKLPKVKATVDIRNDVKAKSVGEVVVIKLGTTASGFRGIAVQFPGMPYDIWFGEEFKNDKRSGYMCNLEIVTN